MLESSTVALMRTLDQHKVSAYDPCTCEVPPELNSIARRKPSPFSPLSPPLVPAQAKLALLWLSRRTNSEISPDISTFAATLYSGELLCESVGISIVKPAPLQDKRIPAQQNIEAFLNRARHLGVPVSALFEIDDLLLSRDVPRVVRTLAALSHTSCPPTFTALATEVLHARPQWSPDDEPDETWAGDLHVQRLVSVAQSASQSSLGVAFAGAQGVGKTQLASALLGRCFAPGTPQLDLELPDSAYPASRLPRRQRTRALRALQWPSAPWEEVGPLAANAVTKLRVRVSGVAMSFIEVPSMRSKREEIDGAGADAYTIGADEEQVRIDLRDERVHALVLVARADQLETSLFIDACRDVHRLFGGRVWRRVVLALSHSDALPPAGEQEQDYWSRVAALRAAAALRPFVGDARVPIVAVDAASGSGVQELANRVTTVISNAADDVGVEAARPKRWWEDYALTALVFLVLSRIKF